MKKYKNITSEDLEEASRITIDKMLDIYLESEHVNIMVFNTEEQEEYYYGDIDSIPNECRDWTVDSWELQLVNNELCICFNATYMY